MIGNALVHSSRERRPQPTSWRLTACGPRSTLRSAEGAVVAQALLLARRQAEHLAEHPLGVLPERRARAVVRRRQLFDAEAVALVVTGAELRMLERDEVL